MSNLTNLSVTADEIRKDVMNNEQAHLNLLEEGLKASFSNLNDFQDWISTHIQNIGLQVERFLVDKSELTDQLANQKTLRENPDSLQQAVNIVGKLRGKVPVMGFSYMLMPIKGRRLSSGLRNIRKCSNRKDACMVQGLQMMCVVLHP